MKPQRPQTNTLSPPEVGATLKKYPFKYITEKIISSAIDVHFSLGSGLLENLIVLSTRRKSESWPVY